MASCIKLFTGSLSLALVAMMAQAAGSTDKNITIPISDTVNLEMIWVEPGTFVMGSPEYELGRGDNETQHEVTLTQGYWLGKYEVTQAQYATLMWNQSYFKGDNLPVELVTWVDAQTFCARLTAAEFAAGRLPEGYQYTLPTEAQWEYACRAGTTTALNNGKNLTDEVKCPEMNEVGWYSDNSKKTTPPVGQKQPNAWGFYDMHGNVWEWCLDFYEEYPTTPVVNPKKLGLGEKRVMRGGSWDADANACRSASRKDVYPGSWDRSYGFRVALVPTKDITIPLKFEENIPSVTLEMLWVEPGTFVMGSPTDELGRDESETQHEVTLTKGYWLGKYEVTQEQYKALTGENPSHFGNNKRPVEQVSWKTAKAFCEKLTAFEKEAGRLPEGYEYTLPTEAQWEYACRAGTTTAFNNGTDIETIEQIYGECPNLDEVGWYFYNSAPPTPRQTVVVGQKMPNAWGFYDMHGNVFEWCLNQYIRGGSYSSDAFNCRSAVRYDSSKPPEGWVGDYYYYDLGFRVALVSTQPSELPKIEYTLTTEGELSLTFTGVLYESDDAVNWKRVEGAVSPFKVEMLDKQKFYKEVIE